MSVHSKSQYMDIVFIDDLRIVVNDYICKDSTNIVDVLLESSTPVFIVDLYIPFKVTSVIKNILVDSSRLIFVEIHVSSESTTDVVVTSAECSTSILDGICAHENNTSDFSMCYWSLVCSYRLLVINFSKYMIEEGIKHEKIATSVVFSKPLESPLERGRICISYMRRRSLYIFNLYSFP